MGCSCRGSSTKNYIYVYTSATGVQTSYRTEIEAKAAQVRAGGAGSVRAVPK